MKMHHIYPAVLQKEESTYTLLFPAFPEISLRFEDTEQETILINAREALAEQIFKMETEGKNLPEAGDLFSLGKKENEIILLIGVHMRRYYMEQKAIKKTLTIPNWLNDLAEEEGINFSHLLQQSLVEELRFREGMLRGFRRGGHHPHLDNREDREGLRDHLRSHKVRHSHRERANPDCDFGSNFQGDIRHFGKKGHHHGSAAREVQSLHKEHLAGESRRRGAGRPLHHKD